MFLQKLREYNERQQDVTPLGYAEAFVRYEIQLNADGELESQELVDLADDTSPQGQRRQVPQVVRSLGVKPFLLCDNAEYTFGLPRQEEDATKQLRLNQRAIARHLAFIALITECLAATRLTELALLLHFLTDDPLMRLRLPPKFNTNSSVAFRVAGNVVTDLAAVKQFWGSRVLAEINTGEDSRHFMPCLVCGQNRPALQTLPGNIRGLPGSQSFGASLISGGSRAFESYGLERAQTSPICAECADAFIQAINRLIRDQRSSYYLGDLALLYWTQRDVDFDLSIWLRDPTEAAVNALLHPHHRTGMVAASEDTGFCAISMTTNTGRVVVRDWVDSTVGIVKQNLALWFERQRIVDAYGEPAKPMGLFALVAAITENANKELPMPTVCALIRATLTATPMPDHFLYQAIRRNRAERNVTRPRAALIKLVLLTQQSDGQMDGLIQLQPDLSEPGYQCGRLLAALEQIQYAAFGNVGSSIVARYYLTASTSPAAIFSGLLRSSKYHLAKLRSQVPSKGWALSNVLLQIQGNLAIFPQTLTLKGQAFFALGYYHQRAHNRLRARAGAARQRKAEVDPAAEAS